MKVAIFKFSLLIPLIFFLLCSFIFSATAEVTTVYEKDHWKVNVIKYDDGAKACTATVYNDEIVLQIYRSKDELRWRPSITIIRIKN